MAREYAKKINRLRVYKTRVRHDYRRLKETLDRKGIKLVCVQYPMRSIEPLKKIFEGQEDDVIFVDNENIFKEAIKKEGFKEYFVDMVGGDSGRCSAKGNRLLAENIADVILKRCFNK